MNELFFKALEHARYYVLADNALVRNLVFFGTVTKVPKMVRTNGFCLRNLEIYFVARGGLFIG